MGCDGGTIPTRDELVRLKKKPEQKDKDAEMIAKWKYCAITQLPLQSPIVACELGKLYNKDSVIELLLDRSKFEGAAVFDHIRGLKDVKELNLTGNPAHVKEDSEKGDAYIDMQTARYICSVSGLEMSGKYKFVYLYDCACVFSDRAMKEVKTDICLKCGKTFKPDDLVILNGTEDEVAELRSRMEQRRLQAKLDKKARKKKAAATVSSADDGPSTSKQPKLDSEKAGPSKVPNGIRDHKSKLANGTSGRGSKLANGKAEEKDSSGKKTSIQKDSTKSSAYKSLFTTSSGAINQPKAHWVTHNPCYW